MKKRVLPLILALLMLAQVFLSGCSEGTENAESTSASPLAQDETVTETVEDETEMTRANTPDDLPELDYDGQNVLILARNKAWFTGEMYVEELNGEVVNDAVYDRDISVEERLNVVVDYQLEADTNSLINNNVTAGTDEYSLHVGSAVDTVQYGINGNYYNLLGDYPEYLNLEQPWWSQYYTEQGEVNGCSFFATGDLCFSLIKLSFVTYANMQLVDDYGLENPYDLVRSGEWTFDKQMEMASQAYVDTNGNGVRDPNDAYGMSMGGEIGLDVYWSAFDLTICQKDENGIPSFQVDEDKMSSVIEKLYSYYIDCEFVFTPVNNGDAEQDVIAQMLADDRMLFSPLRIMHTEQIREMESDYALIPLPKWDEAQQNYYTFVHDQYSIVGIPLSVQDPSMVSAVMEAMAAESYRYVTPAYYDLVLNGKYIRDPASTEMLELAIAGIKIDFGWIHTYSLSSCSQNLLRAILYSQKSNNFSSQYAKMKKVYSKLMEKLIDKVDKIKDDH
ncbi:MAG: hypothetical protein ACI4V1_03050 [Eubacteriales bacterium]